MSPEASFGERSVRRGLVTPSCKVLGNLFTVNLRAAEIDLCQVLAVLKNRDVT